jgi:hypothetical protein
MPSMIGIWISVSISEYENPSEADKVQFINYIKELPSEPSRNAALALYCKKY